VVDDLQPPVEPMRVGSIGQWPAGEGWRYEPKTDGYRGLAFRQPQGVFLQSRAGRNLARYFPDLVEAISGSLSPRSVVDGEIVVLGGDRIDFAALQRRITVGTDPAHPAYLIAFDLLQHPDRGVILRQPLSVRRDLLAGLLAGASPAIALCPQSVDVAVAEEWMTTDWTAAGFEGVVVKAAAGRYKPGGTGWWKRRVTETVDLIVAGITGTLDRPHTLLLGRYEAGRLSYVGRTTALSAAAGAEVAQFLALRRVTVSNPIWPSPLPARWVGFHQTEPLAYLPVTPLLVVEVLADTAFEHGKYRHNPRLVRIRPDVA
jgi:ATP-dependent DNA ligase